MTKKGFIGDLENFVTLFDRKKDTLSWVNANDYFGETVDFTYPIDVKKLKKMWLPYSMELGERNG